MRKTFSFVEGMRNPNPNLTLTLTVTHSNSNSKSYFKLTFGHTFSFAKDVTKVKGSRVMVGGPGLRGQGWRGQGAM